MKDGDEDRTKAAEYLDKVEDLLNDEKVSQMYLDYLIIRAVLETRRKAFTNATELFDKANILCDSLLAQHPRDDQAGDTQKRQLRRAKVRLHLYSGEKFYRDEDYKQARELFATTFYEAEKIDWLRFQIKASERLAYLDIHEGKLREAESRLRKWVVRAEKNKDKRRMAFFHRDFAELHLQKEEFDKAIERATQAKEEFSKQYMRRRVDQMDELLKQIEFCRANSNLRQI
jgi:tetratricopeptide (TPR) repeat protein